MDVWHPAYPTAEYGGLVFVSMGLPSTQPLFPMYDIIDTGTTPGECASDLCGGVFYQPARQGRRRINLGREAFRAVASRGQTPQGRAWETSFLFARAPEHKGGAGRPKLVT